MSEQAKYGPLVAPGPLPVGRPLPGLLIDRAMRGSLTVAANAAKFGQVQLNNNAQQAFILVVRNVEWGAAAAGPAGLAHLQNLSTGGPAGITKPLVPDRAALPGYLEQAALTSQPSFDYVVFNQSIGVSTGSQIPIASLPPGWQLTVTAGVVNVAFTVSLLWEVLTPDEYNAFYGAATNY